MKSDHVYFFNVSVSSTVQSCNANDVQDIQSGYTEISSKDREVLMCHFYSFWAACDWKWSDAPCISTGSDTEAEVAESSLPLPDTSNHADSEENALNQCTARQKIKPVYKIGTEGKVLVKFPTHNKRPIKFKKAQSQTDYKSWMHLCISKRYNHMAENHNQSIKITALIFLRWTFSTIFQVFQVTRICSTLNPLDS